MLLYFAAIILSSLAGGLVSATLHPKLSKLEMAGLGFLLAFGAQAWVLQILHAAGVPPGGGVQLTFSVAAAAGAIVFFEWRSRRKTVYGRRAFAITRGVFRALPPPRVALLVTIVAVLAAGATCWPVLGWDAQGIWVGKAEGLIIANSLRGLEVGEHLHYPIGLPILMAGALDLGGEPAVKLIGPLFAGSLAAVVAGALARQGSAWIGTLVAVAVLVVPFALSYTFIAYADAPMAAAYVASSIYLVEYVRRGNRGALWISAALIGVTSLVRLEAPALFAVNLAVLILFARSERLRSAAIYLGAFVLAWVPWQIISRLVLGIEGGFANLALAPFSDFVTGEFDLNRVGVISEYFLNRVVFWEWWSLTFPLTAAGLILVLVWERRVGAALTALIAGNLLVLLHEYYSSVYYDVDIFGDKLGYFLESGFDRMTLHWAPLGIFGAGLAIQALLSGGTRQAEGLPLRST